MAEKNSHKGKKTKTEGMGYKAFKIDPKELKKRMEEAAKKGVGLVPGRPGKGPCGGCDLVLGPRYPGRF